jgi:hypothetical protein
MITGAAVLATLVPLMRTAVQEQVLVMMGHVAVFVKYF